MLYFFGVKEVEQLAKLECFVSQVPAERWSGLSGSLSAPSGLLQPKSVLIEPESALTILMNIRRHCMDIIREERKTNAFNLHRLKHPESRG